MTRPEEHIRKAQELMVSATQNPIGAPEVYAEVSAHANLATALYAQQAAIRPPRVPPAEPYGPIVGPDVSR